jgi:hypothetical protein
MSVVYAIIGIVSSRLSLPSSSLPNGIQLIDLVLLFFHRFLGTPLFLYSILKSQQVNFVVCPFFLCCALLFSSSSLCV